MHFEMVESARLRTALDEAVHSYVLTTSPSSSSSSNFLYHYQRWRGLTSLARQRFLQMKRTVTLDRLALMDILPAVAAHARAVGGIDLNIDLHEDYFSLETVPLFNDSRVGNDCLVPCRIHNCRHGDGAARPSVDANVVLVLPDRRNTVRSERRAHLLEHCARPKTVLFDLGWASEPVAILRPHWPRVVAESIDVWVGPRAGSDVYLPPWELHSPLLETRYALDQFDKYLPRYSFEEKSEFQRMHQLADAVFVADNCQPGPRLELLRALQRLGFVFDSPGKCLHTRVLEQRHEQQARDILARASADGHIISEYNYKFHLKMMTKAVLVSQYKMYLAFENSLEDHWVTEKFTTALAVGTVPVYLGTNDARAFDPYVGAVVHVSDYASNEQLVAALRHVGASAQAYAWHTQWRGLPVRTWNSHFLHLLRRQRSRSLCGICTVVAAMQLRRVVPTARHFDEAGSMLYGVVASNTSML